MSLSEQNEELYRAIREELISTLFLGLFYGAYIVLMIGSVYTLIRRQGGELQSKPSIAMLSLIGIMFSAATIAFALQLPPFLRQLPSLIDPTVAGTPWSNRRTNIIVSVGAVSVRINYVLSDAIVVWRALVLWGSDFKIFAILAIFMLGTTAAAGTDVGLSLAQLFGTLDVVDDQSAVKGGERSLILVGPTLGTNVVATSLIAYKAWRHRAFIRENLIGLSSVTKVQKILALLVESGIIYCIVWIFYLLASFRVFPAVGFAVMDSIMVQIAGIYPTIIIVLVSLQKSHCEEYSRYDVGETLRFATAPGRTSTGLVPQDSPSIYAIRDPVADSDDSVADEAQMKFESCPKELIRLPGSSSGS
ncbi:hypothetical protein BV25DRAFT_1920576 [Artomyces pyxidatus]|uniref:Uncharacterized protein n=1 Tax=Artomyces pyxidatus TaxID=48021 RepID=A0ACB8SM34_9AGAM|nr:hypothetical protein BV25DRAFT_1920576 [Artomyces pyxidatus]